MVERRRWLRRHGLELSDVHCVRVRDLRQAAGGRIRVAEGRNVLGDDRHQYRHRHCISELRDLH